MYVCTYVHVGTYVRMYVCMYVMYVCIAMYDVGAYFMVKNESMRGCLIVLLTLLARLLFSILRYAALM